MLQYIIVFYLVILSASVVDSQCPDFTQFTGQSTNQFSLSYQINSAPTAPSVSNVTTVFQSGNFLSIGFDVCPTEEFSIQFAPNGFTLDDLIIGVFQVDVIKNTFVNISSTVTSNFGRFDCVFGPPGSTSFIEISVFRVPPNTNIANGVTATFSYEEDNFGAIILGFSFISQGETLYTPSLRNTNNDAVQLFVYQGSVVATASGQLSPGLPEPRTCSSTTILSSFYYTAGLLFVTLLFYSF